MILGRMLQIQSKLWIPAGTEGRKTESVEPDFKQKLFEQVPDRTQF